MRKKLYDLYATFVSERAIQGDFCNRVYLHFGHPRLDTCKICDKFEVKMDSENDKTLNKSSRRKSFHFPRAEAAQDCMRAGFPLPKADQYVWTIAFDLQASSLNTSYSN